MVSIYGTDWTPWDGCHYMEWQAPTSASMFQLSVCSNNISASAYQS